jgi:hypothetical protein
MLHLLLTGEDKSHRVRQADHLPKIKPRDAYGHYALLIINNKVCRLSSSKLLISLVGKFGKIA